MKIKYIIIFAMWIVSCGTEFADEMQTYERECLGEEKFPCLSGGCIEMSQHCDGQANCEDGSDENFCPENNLDAEFCNETHQFMCLDNKRCIPKLWICNNETECDDGSDEVNCTAITESNTNSTCKGFVCDGKCVSRLWGCDGVYDCEDKTDENTPELCHRDSNFEQIFDGWYCEEYDWGIGFDRYYKCLDSSFCLPSHMMCDGMQDCKDGSDEGPICINWHNMCANFTCHGNNSKCTPDRKGPVCLCDSPKVMGYNYVSQRCESLNCEQEEPYCSQICHGIEVGMRCECEEGYIRDRYEYLCYATGPEAMLFMCTPNSISYLKITSKELVTLATGVKHAHGVSSDGTFVYWVEKAQGHQSIMRARLNDVERTKKVVIGLGLEDPGDIAIDWVGNHIYFSDAERGVIFVCYSDGTKCATIQTDTKSPRFVTLDARNGRMYWADWHGRAVIMSAHMDGAQASVLADKLASFATGLALDAPNNRLYFVDSNIRVVLLTNRRVYTLLEEPAHHPFSVSVFENTVYWSDWTSNSIRTSDKIHTRAKKHSMMVTMDGPIVGMHMYHPLLMRKTPHPCNEHPCSYFCLITSNTTYSCGCPDSMEKVDGHCLPKPDYRPQYLIVGGGQFFTKIQYDVLGNPESHATQFDIGRVQAMAHDSLRDVLYIYDGQRRTLGYTNMSSFTHGKTNTLIYFGLENVVDMDYDYVSDSLYILDAGRRFVEVVSLSSKHRALVYKFTDQEIPIALCVLPEYGRMLVAVVESEEDNSIHIDSIGLDGEGRKHVLMNNLRGPHVRLRYAAATDLVYISDETSGVIDYMHPEGTGHENFRELTSTITSLAITDVFAFWTDRRTPRLFWAELHETMYNIRPRRIELSIFPNNTQLLIQATSLPPDPKNPLLTHPCKADHPCSHICVQTSHSVPHKYPVHFHLGYKCLCPPGLLLVDGVCAELVQCSDPDQLYCHKSNHCFHKNGRCDGVQDCGHGEDEEGCVYEVAKHPCNMHEILCGDVCVDKGIATTCSAYEKLQNSVLSPEAHNCSAGSVPCQESPLCVERSQLCDGRADCPDASDELPHHCDTLACFDNEFMCTSGSCILKTWKCDGDEDCNDASDEIGCENMTCAPGFYQCRNRECIELKKRCDGHQDCFDFSDEEQCDEPIIVQIKEEPRCPEGEFACELNKSICVPHTARCNLKSDCPSSTDEFGCDYHCSRRKMFSCRQEMRCLHIMRVCDDKKDCLDGTDETPEACASVNKTSHLYPSRHSPLECADGFVCASGQCVEWRDVCDNTPHCSDGSDEGGLCAVSCRGSGCAQRCVPTPLGGRCACAVGFAARLQRCEDVDECARAPCSQRCHNTPGSFLCSCHHGYALRSDRRSCKAVKGNMSVLYVSGNTVRSIATDGASAVEYSDPAIGVITDLDVNVRKNKLYVTSAESGKLIEVNGTHNVVTVTNVGHPTKVAVDWVTGNVYFADISPKSSCIRVCNVAKKRCARLQKLPTNSKVTALVVEPASRRMFYCVEHAHEWAVWSAALSGRHLLDLAPSDNCSGLAADSFTRTLYVAETAPPHIAAMDFDGAGRKKILAEHLELQAPHGLAIFEDYIYYLVANSFRLSRCILYGRKYCETYIYRVFDANTFVIAHESVQRDDISNDCEKIQCSNLCALDEHGPVCVCDDGTFAKDGNCVLMKKSQLPLFNGWSQQDSLRAHHASFTVIVTVLVLFAVYLCLFVYYHFVYKPRRTRSSPYTEVRFQNKTDDDRPFISNASVEVECNGRASGHEFVNPLQYVRNTWQQSFRKKSRPIGTSGLSIDVNGSPQQNLSDTESDLDARETKRLFRK